MLFYEPVENDCRLDDCCYYNHYAPEVWFANRFTGDYLVLPRQFNCLAGYLLAGGIISDFTYSAVNITRNKACYVVLDAKQ